jgi:hypothetical protein
MGADVMLNKRLNVFDGKGLSFIREMIHVNESSAA